MKWKQIDLPSLTLSLSTASEQPLSRDKWPTWTQKQLEFAAGWFTPTDGSVAPSTVAMSTAHVQAYVDFERRASVGAPFRYYRYLYATIADGRTFQSEPLKNVEYGHHRDGRPTWLTAPRS